MTRQRPTGVVLVAIWFFLSGVWYSLSGAAVAFFIADATSRGTKVAVRTVG